MLEGITALGNGLNCLCVKSKGEEGQAGDREPGEEKKRQSCCGLLQTAKPFPHNGGLLSCQGGHVGPSVSGM